MQGQTFTVDQAASAVGCNPRTIRRHLAAGQLPGAYQQRTAHGQAWRIPSEALDKLRAHLALDVVPGAVELAEPEPVQPLEHQAPPAGQQLAPVQLEHQAAGWIAGLDAVRAVLASQGAAVEAMRGALDRAQDDSTWWRCEALDARQQLEAARVELDQARQQLAAVQLEAAELRQQLATIEARAGRATVPLAQLRAQLRAVEGGARA
jgi:excisionase family DNA binding protein